MTIYNLKNGVQVSITEDIDGYIGASYVVNKIGITGCAENNIVAQGTVSDTNDFKVTLDDGIYKVTVTPNNIGLNPTISSNFVVFYNYLPCLVEDIKSVLCSDFCNECTEESKSDSLLKKFYSTIMYLNCLGLLPELPLTRKISCKHFHNYKKEKESLCNYGKFNFDYNNKIKEFFTYLYMEIYNKHLTSIKEVDCKEDCLNSVFNFQTISDCITKQGFDTEDIMCQINNLNCNCDG